MDYPKLEAAFVAEFAKKSHKELKDWIDECEMETPSLRDLVVWTKAINQEIRLRNIDSLEDLAGYSRSEEVKLRTMSVTNIPARDVEKEALLRNADALEKCEKRIKALERLQETPNTASSEIRAMIPMETILAAIEALELGVEFGRKALSVHDSALGRNIRRGRVGTFMIKAEIKQMLQTQKILRSISEDSRHI